MSTTCPISDKYNKLNIAIQGVLSATNNVINSRPIQNLPEVVALRAAVMNYSIFIMEAKKEV